MNESIKIVVLFFWVLCSAYFQEQAEQSVKDHPVFNYDPASTQQETSPPDSVIFLNIGNQP